jgi:hypothetical protein
MECVTSAATIIENKAGIKKDHESMSHAWRDSNPDNMIRYNMKQDQSRGFLYFTRAPMCKLSLYEIGYSFLPLVIQWPKW